MGIVVCNEYRGLKPPATIVRRSATGMGYGGFARCCHVLVVCNIGIANNVMFRVTEASTVIERVIPGRGAKNI